MARFTQDIKETNDPNYLGYSRGVDPAPTPKTYDVLFKGLENIAKGVVGAVDEGIKTKAQKEVDTAYNKLWDDQGVKVALDSADPLNLDRAKTGATPGAADRADPNQKGNPDGGPGQLPPAGIAEVGKDLGRLKAAYEDGRLNNSYYLTRAEAIARQLRSRFPGYEEHVDQLIKSKLGITPANELRKSLLNDMETSARARAASADDYDKFLEKHLGDVQADAVQRKQEGRPYTLDELRSHVSKRQRFRADMGDEKSALALRASRGEVVAEDAYVTANARVSQIVSGTINEAINVVAGQQGQDFQKILQQAIANGKPLDEKGKEMLVSQFNALRLKIGTSIDEFLNKDGTKSYASMIKSQEKIDAIKKNGLARIDMMEKALFDGNYGLIGVQARMTKAITENNTLRALSDPFFRNLKTVNDLGGQVMVERFLLMNGGLSDMDAAIRNFVLVESAASGKALPALLAELKTMGKVDREVGAAYNKGVLHQSIIANAVGALADPKMGVEAAKNLAKTLFGPESKDLLNTYKNKTDLYNQLTTPEVTKKMKEIGGVEFENYKVWVGDSLQSAHKQSFDSLASILKDLPHYQLRRDEKTGEYKTVIDPAKVPKGGDFSFRQVNPALLNNTVNQINTALKNAIEVFGSPKELFNVLDQMGLGVPPVEDQKPKTGADGKRSEIPNDSMGFVPSELITLAANRVEDAGRSVDPVWTGANAVQKALLNTIAWPESNSRYDIRFAGGGPGVSFTGEDHPRVRESIPWNPGKTSDAAGRYQFLSSTWDGLGGGKFTPEEQDKNALKLAARDFKSRTGEDLWTVLEEEGMSPRVIQALAPTWEAFTKDAKSHRRRFERELTRFEAGEKKQVASKD